MMRLKKILLTACFSVFLFAAYSAYIYYRAPVLELRGEMAYTPYHASEARYIGLHAQACVPYNELPPALVIGTIAMEDRMFFNHAGINPYSIRKVLIQYFRHARKITGASTLTQQLAKNAFLTPERSVWRKYKEMIYAFKLERNFSKQELFSLYACITQMAPGIYGMEDGAWFYFHKHLRDLSEAEAMFLVAMISSPEQFFSLLKEKNFSLLHRQLSMALNKYWITLFYLQQISPDQSQSPFSPEQVPGLLKQLAYIQYGITEQPHGAANITPQLQKEFAQKARLISTELLTTLSAQAPFSPETP